MLQGITDNGEMKNIKTNDEGILKVIMGEGSSVETTSDKEVTLNASILTVGTASTSIAINKKVTSIMVANYSDIADITVNAGGKDLQVGANLALELPVNLQVENLSITSSADDTKIQLVVKGVE